MNQKTAKKLRKHAAKLALHTVLAVEDRQLKLAHGAGTFCKIYGDLKRGRLCPD